MREEKSEKKRARGGTGSLLRTRSDAIVAMAIDFPCPLLLFSPSRSFLPLCHRSIFLFTFTPLHRFLLQS